LNDTSAAPSGIDTLAAVIADSEALYTDIEGLLADFGLPELDEREVATLLLCQLGFEHGAALRGLLGAGLSTSAVALLRVQFEAVVRAAWLLHGANDEQAARLAAPLSPETEQGAKNLPSVDKMIGRLEQHGPRGSGALLRRFHVRMGRALNSFVHAGIHPIQRRASGYPEPLLRDLVQNSNAVSMLALVVLSELCAQEMAFHQRYMDLHHRHRGVLPPLEAL
jgi:hypothetical protein